MCLLIRLMCGHCCDLLFCEVSKVILTTSDPDMKELNITINIQLGTCRAGISLEITKEKNNRYRLADEEDR